MKTWAALYMAFLTGWPMAVLAQDDHGNTRATATVVEAPSSTSGRIETRGDQDYFRFEIPSAGRLTVQTTGGTDTYGRLYRGDSLVRSNDDSGSSLNFRITAATAQAGPWYVAVSGYDNATGAYTLQVEFELAFDHPALKTYPLPLVRPADFAGQESLVRISNRSAMTGTVGVIAFDDTGERFRPVILTLGARQAVNITSSDLERGNTAKGLPVGVGDGEGSWRLDLVTTLTIEALAYIRTPDGFLTSMHDIAPIQPVRANASEWGHWVPFFNPGSNIRKASHLRLVNPGTEPAEVTVAGHDDAGNDASGSVRLTLAAGAARTLTAQQLEGGGAGIDGRLGDGLGKWRLNVSSTADIYVMSLLTTPTGHLANLSTAPWYDDHGDTEVAATVVGPLSVIEGRLETPGDRDVFRIHFMGSHSSPVRTTGDTDTYGTAVFPNLPRVPVEDDNSGFGFNFRTNLQYHIGGTWYVQVTGGRSHPRIGSTGRYTLWLGETYGAIAGKLYDYDRGKYCRYEGEDPCGYATGSATEFRSGSAARAAAFRTCNEDLARNGQPQNCEERSSFVAFSSKCAALAVGWAPWRAMGFGTGVGDSLHDARIEALGWCNRNLYRHGFPENARGCIIAASGCTP